VRVWAWFTRQGAGKIYQIDEYSMGDLLEDEFVPSLVARYGVGPIGFIQNSESPDFLSIFPSLSNPQKVRNWFRKCYAIVSPPPKSKKLCPFSTIWVRIEETIRLQRNQPLTAKELFDLIELLWEAETRQPLYWSGLSDSLEFNLKQILLANGERV
jgi:hypothetical protein